MIARCWVARVGAGAAIICLHSTDSFPSCTLTTKHALPPNDCTVGTSWSTAFVCLLAALAAAASGQGALAASVLAAPLLGGFCLLHGIAAAKRHASPLCALQPIAAVYQQQLRPWQQLAARLRSSARQRRAAT